MRGLSIGKLAKTVGVHLETIRYYERIGLMPEPGRTDSGYRSYGNEHARHLSFIKRARELDFSIDEVRALLALAAPDRASCADAQALTKAHLEKVRGKISDLRRLERMLAATVAKCSGEATPICPVLDMLERGRTSAQS
jgi:MerR family transcriptional regulator, mercuric resistance operon regulatory protein